MNDINNENRKIIPPHRREQVEFGDDETLFRHKLITPEHPEAFLKNAADEIFRVPAYSHTMSIGNFNTNDLEAARYMFTIARVLESHLYNDVAIEWLTRIVDLSVTSLAYQGKLLTQLTTQHYGIYRKEEVSETDEDRKGKGPDIMKKINEMRMMERRKLDNSELGRF